MGRLDRFVSVLAWLLAVMLALEERSADEERATGGETMAGGQPQTGGGLGETSAGEAIAAGGVGSTGHGSAQATGTQAGQGWVEGDGGHDCPAGYPIKGNASSMIYHMPGESSYDATIPEICFASEEVARSQGYRPRKH